MSDQTCYVYLIEADHSIDGRDLIKVGISRQPGGRLASFQTGFPYTLWLRQTWRMPTREDAAWVEREFHEASAQYRRRGEWFSVDAGFSSQLVDDICVDRMLQLGNSADYIREWFRSIGYGDDYWIDAIGLNVGTVG